MDYKSQRACEATKSDFDALSIAKRKCFMVCNGKTPRLRSKFKHFFYSKKIADFPIDNALFLIHLIAIKSNVVQENSNHWDKS